MPVTKVPKSEVDLKQLLEAGVHFGHQTRRWNPKMAPYIFGVRGGIHIIDLIKTADHLEKAAAFAGQAAAAGGKILFVGTKRQAAAIVKTEAEAAGMPYVTERWLGGMLTNFRTIRRQVSRLKKLEAEIESGEVASRYNKKEAAGVAEEVAKLTRIFAGVKDMEALPGAVFVVDAPHEQIAVAEATKLGIPVIGIADSNADPATLDYPIPGNDDALKAIQIITHTIAAAAKEGWTKYQSQQPKEDETNVA